RHTCFILSVCLSIASVCCLIAGGSLGGSQLLKKIFKNVCGPTVHRACGKNMYVNGYCFLLNQHFQQVQRFPETLSECSAYPTDIAFLIDGSGSINTQDFNKMKLFVSESIRRLSGRNTRFALMQFSDKFMEHFNFNSNDPAHRVMDIHQIHGWTHTATAIKKVVNELFTSYKGSRDGATKILIVITDGKKTDDLPYRHVIPLAQKAEIIRYAIGVGGAFSTTSAKQELRDIASEPKDEHIFKVDNFDALRGIQNQLQDRIFSIEGTQFQRSSSFQLEMSQEGFSALLTPEETFLGAVGAYDWSGGVFLYQNNKRNSLFINVSSTAEDVNNIYLGYSSQTVQLNGRRGLVLGAPRYNYVGKVVLFERYRTRPVFNCLMQQVGSYFGATICSVDLDQDTNTDLILVGAPMYYDGVTGGRVYICHFKPWGRGCCPALKGLGGHIFGRFGASMAETGDITGDRWTDVAIGAPMENENAGALYIFAGKQTSINPNYIQRIEGLKFSGGFLYFGQAVSGGTDLTGDGLKDIVVGRQGQVVLLRSRPILQMRVSIDFHPPVIPTAVFDCHGQEFLGREASKATVCFKVALATQQTLGKVTVPICIEDTLTPISLWLNYSLTGRPISNFKGLQPILSGESPEIYTAQLPFEKNCGSDGKCQDALQTSFTFSGLGLLVVGQTPEVNVTASLWNHGEDSYSTTLTFFYPAGLSYRKVTLLPVGGSHKKVVSVRCHSAPDSEDQANWATTCNINHPIFWSGGQVRPPLFATHICICMYVFTLFHLSSENGGNITKDMVHQADLPVKYAVYIIITAIEESTKYVNFTIGQEEASKSVEHRYEVKNLRERSIPISVRFQIPVKLNGIQLWNVSQVFPSEVSRTGITKSHTFMLSHECTLWPDSGVSFHLPQDCSRAACKVIRCDVSLLELRKQPLAFRIKGDISFRWASQVQRLLLGTVHSALLLPTQVQTVVERIEFYNYLPVIIGSSLGGLVLLAVLVAVLYKVRWSSRWVLKVKGVGLNLSSLTCVSESESLSKFAQRWLFSAMK
uniref:VWFA domain-containing protein n=1 Tax=Varanus komodoensis TaxID=61221 RepID=A0A8D2IRS4_VARKO